MTDDIKKVRGFYYEFFAIPLFFYEKDDFKFNKWQKQIDFLKQSPISDSDLCDFNNLKKFTFQDFKDEQNCVLFDFSYTNIPLTASFYIEGRDEGAAKLLVIDTLKKSKFRLNKDNCKDSEDFLGFIFFAMSSLINDEVGKNLFLSTELFVNVINEFADEFIFILKNHKYAQLFLSYANLFESFIEFERSVLSVKSPGIKDIARQSMQKKMYKSKLEDLKKKYEFYEDYDNY